MGEPGRGKLTSTAPGPPAVAVKEDKVKSPKSATKQRKVRGGTIVFSFYGVVEVDKLCAPFDRIIRLRGLSRRFFKGLFLEGCACF